MDSQLKKIILHIQQDSAEKVDEVTVKAEEEFKHEKLREMLLGYAKVDEEYRAKEARVRSESLVYESKMKNKCRLKLLEMKYDQVEDVLAKAKMRLANKDHPVLQEQYRAILKALVMQGLCKLVEPRVTVYCRKTDCGLLRLLLAECVAAYSVVSALTVELSLGEGRHLSPTSEGGLLLATHEVSLDNTLASRLETVGFYMLPHIADALFGQRPEEAPLPHRQPSYLPPLARLERLPSAFLEKARHEPPH